MELDFLPDAGHAESEDTESASADDIEVPTASSKNALVPFEGVTTDNRSLARRNRTTVHHVGRGKAKRWRANMGVTRQASQSQKVLKSIVELNSGGADPFGAFELPQDSTTDLALHHWINVFQNTRMPITPRQDWMKINLSDKTLLSVTTYCSSNHYYFMRGMRAPPSTLVQKVNAIRNINNTIASGDIPNDYTLIAVAVMTILECLAGDLTACIIHRKGLEQMVHLRGGLQDLGFDGAVQRTISWADTSSAIILGQKPSLKPILIPNIGESAIPGFTVGDLRERLLVYTNSADLSKKIIYIWLRLRYLTQVLTSITDQTSTELDDIFFSDKIDFVERHVLSVLQSEGLAESPVADFLTAFLNASLIYIYDELRECPKWTNVCICLSQRIRSQLQIAKLSSVTKHCPDLLLWILLLGRSGNSPLAEPGRIWYSKVISNMEAGLEMTVPPMLSGLNYFSTAEKSMVMMQRSPSSEVVVTGQAR